MTRFTNLENKKCKWAIYPDGSVVTTSFLNVESRVPDADGRWHFRHIILTIWLSKSYSLHSRDKDPYLQNLQSTWCLLPTTWSRTRWIPCHSIALHAMNATKSASARATSKNVLPYFWDWSRLNSNRSSSLNFLASIMAAVTWKRERNVFAANSHNWLRILSCFKLFINEDKIVRVLSDTTTGLASLFDAVLGEIRRLTQNTRN